MAKMVELRLVSLGCEFAGDDGDDLEVSGRLVAECFDLPGQITETDVVFDFPEGPLTMAKGHTLAMDRSVRFAMATPEVDPPGFGSLNVRIGGVIIERDAAPDTDDPLGEEWLSLHTNDVANPEPFEIHLYFGRRSQIVRADFTIHVAHPL